MALTYRTEQIPSEGMVQTITEMHTLSDRVKRTFARRWYDNNFFDDGYHFRFVHRTTGRVVDLSDRGNFNAPRRAIPKASRQIRGIANLLLSFDYHPVIYPRRVERDLYDPDIIIPETGEVIKNPYYMEDLNRAKLEARFKGYFIEDIWRDLDMFEEKLPLMLLSAMRNSASFMQFWYDDEAEKIKGAGYDAFDIDVLGNYQDIEQVPFIGKCIPRLTADIQVDEKFDEEKRLRVVSDNKLAASEIKEAYLRTKFGHEGKGVGSETSLQYEYFIKERLTEENWSRLVEQEDADIIGKGKSKGDIVVRQIFTAGGQTLADKYIPGTEYPFVDFRMEAGPIWQTPLIERFIPQNKSIDDVLTRVERHINSNPMGIWTRQKGENFEISNSSNAYVLEYEGRPPVNVPTSPMPADPFNLIEMQERFMEEQGVTTSALAQLPPGVRAGVAIDSLKASEYSNLTMNQKMLKKTIEKIACKILYLADTYIMNTRQVSYDDGGETQYFDVIGKQGAEIRKNRLQEELPEKTIVIDSSDRVRIEVESGPGYTVEGKRANMLDLSNFFMNMAKEGLVNPEAMRLVIEKLLDTYQFGATSEFLEEFDKFKQGSGQQLDQQTLDKIKLSVAEVISDLQSGASPGAPQPGMVQPQSEIPPTQSAPVPPQQVPPQGV